VNYELLIVPHSPSYISYPYPDICLCPAEGQVYGHPVGLKVFGQGEVFGWAGAYKTMQGNFKVGVMCWVVRYGRWIGCSYVALPGFQGKVTFRFIFSIP